MLKASLSWISLLMSILIQEYLPVLENYRIYINYKEPFSSFSSRHRVSWFNINPSPTLCSIYCLSSFTWIRILKVDGQQKENTSYVKNTAVTSAKILITWIQLQDLDNVNVHMECFGVFSSWKPFISYNSINLSPTWFQWFIRLCIMCSERRKCGRVEAEEAGGRLSSLSAQVPQTLTSPCET